jgi:hypothetical protein
MSDQGHDWQSTGFFTIARQDRCTRCKDVSWFDPDPIWHDGPVRWRGEDRETVSADEPCPGEP